MKKKIIDYVMNYVVITVTMLVALGILFAIYLGFLALWNFNFVLFGILIIVLIVSGVVTYIITNEGE